MNVCSSVPCATNLILPTTCNDEGGYDKLWVVPAERRDVVSHTIYMTMTSSKQHSLQNVIWSGSLPLEIRLSPSECRVYDQADSYFVSRLHQGVCSIVY